ncbi:hypothetical protein BJX76DRAFT_359409 [Aspergillus varians]
MPDGTMYMDIIVQKSSDKSAEGYVWGIALLRTNASGELLGTIYTCKTPETAAAPAPHDSCFEPIPRRVRPSGMQDMKYDACYRPNATPRAPYTGFSSTAPTSTTTTASSRYWHFINIHNGEYGYKWTSKIEEMQTHFMAAAWESHREITRVNHFNPLELIRAVKVAVAQRERTWFSALLGELVRQGWVGEERVRTWDSVNQTL